MFGFNMRTIVSILRRNFLYVIFVVTITTIISLYLLSKYFGLKPPDQITLAAYTGIPLFIITLLQLERTLRQQRANFVKDYIAQFFLNRDLISSFQNLIKEFTREKWRAVEKIVNENKEELDNNPDQIWEFLKEINKNKSDGERYFHPSYFQGSEEELNLDGILGFFDIIGYHYHRQLVPIEDIVSTVGFYLRAINSNLAIKEYLKIIRERWENDKEFQEAYGLLHTFYYLDRLLVSIEVYDQQNASKLRSMAEDIKAR